jgi:preprotein translocase subunit YajC
MKWVFMLKREQEKEREREREEKRVYKLRKGMQVVLDLFA